jgi:WD40 repeat protein
MLTADEEDSLQRLLNPIDFSTDCAELDKQYVTGTREWLFVQVADWVNQNTRDSVLWINAGAGVGKSVAASQLTSRLRGRNRLITSFFLKYNDTRKSDPRVVLSTISYGLCQWYSPIGRKLLDANYSESDLADMRIEELFNNLIVKPLEAIGNYRPKHSVVIIIDALDECYPVDQLLSLLACRFVELNKSRPWLKLLLTSRPEAGIADAFSGVLTKEIKPKSDDNIKDLRILIKHRLRRLTEDDKIKAAEIILSKQNEDDEDGGEQRSVSADNAKTFVWINLILNTVDERRTSMKITLDVVKEINDSASNIGELYHKTFEKIYTQSSDCKTLVTLLSALATSQTILTPAMICDLFFADMDKPQAYKQIYEGLNSIRLVLATDVDPNNHHQLVKFNHKSVVDYLVSSVPENPEPFHVSPDFHIQFAKACLSLILRHEPVINICEIYDFHDKIPNLQDKVNEKISFALRYSVAHWITHFTWPMDGKQSTSITWTKMKELDVVGTLCAFLSTHALFWLECASLTQVVKLLSQRLLFLSSKMSGHMSADTAPPSIMQKIDISSDGGNLPINEGNISIIVNDIYRFLRAFAEAIVASAPQVYNTGFLFVPKGTLLYKTYRPTVEPQQPYLVTSGLASSWDQCETVFTKCYGNIRAIGPDGEFMAVKLGKTIEVWDAIVGKHVHTLKVDCSEELAVQFVSGGMQLIAFSESGKVFLWDTLTGNILDEKSCKFPDEPLNWRLKAVSPNRKWLAVCPEVNHNTSIALLDFNTGELDHTFQGHPDVVVSVAFHPDSQKIISGSKSGKKSLWDVKSKTPIHTCTFEGKEIGPIGRLSYTADGQRFVGTSSSGIIGYGGSSGIIIGDNVTIGYWPWKDILEIAVSFDGTRIALIEGDCPNRINVYDTRTMNIIQSLHTQPNEHGYENYDVYNSIAFYPDSNRLVFTESREKLKVWDVDMQGVDADNINGHELSNLTVKLSQDRCWIASTSRVDGDDDGYPRSFCNEIWVWDALSGQPRSKSISFLSPVTLMGFSEDGKQVVYDYAQPSLWDHRTGKTREFGNVDWQSSRWTLSPNSDLIALLYDTLLVLKELESLKVIQTFECHSSDGSSYVVSLAFSPDATWLGARFRDGTFRIYSLHTKEIFVLNTQAPLGPKMSLDKLMDRVKESNCFAFSDDNETLAAGHSNGAVTLWNFKTGVLLRTLDCFKIVSDYCDSELRTVQEIAFSKDRKRLAASGSKNKMVIWDVGSGEVLKTIKGSSFCNQQLQVALSDVVSDSWLQVGDSNWWAPDVKFMSLLPTRLFSSSSSKPFTTHGWDFKFFTENSPHRIVNIVVC